MKMSTKEKILECATKLFAEKGYSAISVRTLAREVGITEGSIYNHFKSKKEILETILENHEKQLLEFMPTGRSLITAYEKDDWCPAWTKRIEQMRTMPQMAVKSLEISKILTQEQYRNPKASQIVNDYYISLPVEITKALLDHLKNKKEISQDSDSEILAISYQYPIYGMVQEYLIAVATDNDGDSVLDKMEKHIRYFWEEIIGRKY
jgi:AcrR family transcriptional regulator